MRYPPATGATSVADTFTPVTTGGVPEAAGTQTSSSPATGPASPLMRRAPLVGSLVRVPMCPGAAEPARDRERLEAEGPVGGDRARVEVRREHQLGVGAEARRR